MYTIPTLPLQIDLESKTVLRQLNLANKKLAELKGVALTIPNESILINTLILQEAKESSAVENIITTHDDLYKADAGLTAFAVSSSTKEVVLYSDALKRGFDLIRNNKILSLNHIKEIQEVLEKNKAGFRKVPGTNLQNARKEIVYVPPQRFDDIQRHMENLAAYINDDTLSDVDPLIKLAIIHHQFESIHPFYDGNGRTGRIINSLFLILKGVEETAEETIILVKQINILMQEYKIKMREVLGRQYSHELLNNIFKHPYTKIDFVMQDLHVSRVTAAKYLNLMVSNNMLNRIKMGKSNFYLNPELTRLFINHSDNKNVDSFESIESISTII